MSERKGCPFCGAVVNLASISVVGAKKIVKGTFECYNCSAKITIQTRNEAMAFDALEKAWNRRSDA